MSDFRGSSGYRRVRRSRVVAHRMRIAACAVAAWLGSVSAAYACCSVVSVESGRAVVTAFEYDSNQIFTFRVSNRARLAAIKACQSFSAPSETLQPGAAFKAQFDAGPIDAQVISAPGTAGRVLGVQPHAKFEGVEILLLELARSEGDLVTATTLYCNRGAAQVDLASDLRARASKAKLLDAANRTAYEVVRIGGPGGAAMVSDHGPGLKLQPQQSARTWMRFNAPRGETVTLVVPGAAASFENVPLSGPGTAPASAEPRADRTAAGGDRKATDAADLGKVAIPNTASPMGPAGVPTVAQVPTNIGRVMPLRAHPRGQEIASAAASKATSPQISISLLAGEDYLVNDCLGVHASAGKFKTRLETPSVRMDGTGIVMSFLIPRISVDALTVRVRPNPGNVTNPCTFGQRFSIGGSIGDIEYEMRYDPILDLTECKLTRPGEFRTRWNIGGLNLKPLQNDLDNAARRMIEAALNGESFIELPDGLLRPHELIFRYTIDEVNERLGTNCQPV